MTKLFALFHFPPLLFSSIICYLMSNLGPEEVQAIHQDSKIETRIENETNQTRQIIKVLNNIFGKNYDDLLRPKLGQRVRVGVTIYINRIIGVSESALDFTMDFYFRQYWNDPRLAFGIHLTSTGNETEAVQQNFGSIVLNPKYASRIWHPDTYFANEKKITIRNEFTRLYFNGTVLKSSRVTLTTSCAMVLLYYPADNQPCKVEFGSYGYADEELEYYWYNGNSSVNYWWETILLPHFSLLGHRQRTRIGRTETGTYSHLSVEFLFQRHLGPHILRSYLPPVFIVVISWLVFWMGREVIVERMALGVTAVLTATTILMANSSPGDFLRSLDIYLSICFILVFSALLESSVVGYLYRRQRIRLAKKCQDKTKPKDLCHSQREGQSVGECLIRKEEEGNPSGGGENPEFEKEDQKEERGNCRKFTSCFRISMIDAIARFVFPIGFTMFVYCYWHVYIYRQQYIYWDWEGFAWAQFDGWEMVNMDFS